MPSRDLHMLLLCFLLFKFGYAPAAASEDSHDHWYDYFKFDDTKRRPELPNDARLVDFDFIRKYIENHLKPKSNE